MLRIQGAQVEASVPGWLLNATANHAAINLARRAANELNTRPEAYGFDPAAVYTVFCQTWDRATTDIRSVAFGRDIVGQEAVGLVPDPYYMHSRGYSELRRLAADLPRWASRSDRVAWRGSVTGDNSIVSAEDLPRIRLALICRDRPDADVGLIGVHSTMNNGRVPGMLDEFILSHHLIREGWHMADFGRYKFTIDIDGHANAWGLLEKMILGCCVLKVESPYEQWYYDRLAPWYHYVPVRADLSNFDEIVIWCRDNAARCEWIGANGARLAASLAMERELPNTCRTLMAAALPRRAARLWQSNPQRTWTASPYLLEDAAFHAESLGRLNEAIDAYGRLVDAGVGGAGALMRRHDLLRQRGDFAAAAADMARAVVAEPNNEEPPLRLAQFLALIGRDIAAVQLLKQALALAPDRDEIRIALAGSSLKLSWLDTASAAVRELPDNLPGWWADLRRKALDDYATCRAAVLLLLRKRRAAGGLTPEQSWDLAGKLHAIGRGRSAWALCQDFIRTAPELFAPRDLASKIIARQQGPAEALTYFTSLPTGLAGDDQRLARRCEMLFELGEFRQVVDTVDIQGTSEVMPNLRSIVAFSTSMLSRTADLISLCREWMEQSPHDIRPAELVCGAQHASDATVSETELSAECSLGQFWLTGTIPNDVRETMDSWIDRHAGMRRHLHDEESARAFLAAEYDAQILRAFDLCADPAAKAGYFRLAWLYRNGGLWINVDQRCIRPAEHIIAKAARASIAVVRSGYMTGYVQDAFIGARAQSATIGMALETATATILSKAKRREPLWRWEAVGPGLLTRIVARSICATNGLTDELLLPPITYQSYASTANTLAYKT